jgi:hypothetical protein
MPQALTTEAPQPTRPEPLYVKLPARGQRTVLDHDAVASNQRSLTYIALAPVIGGEAAAKVILAGEEEPESLG